MYLSFYGLKRKPFQNSTNPSFFWLGETHKEALAIFRHGILNNQGFYLLTGDVGTGKTTFINALTNSLGDEVIVAKVPDPGLETIDFMNYISHAFDMKSKFASKETFLIHFGHFLNLASSAGKKVLLIIDECQNLSSDLLEEIRKLSNIEKNGTKSLNIILVGQNEFNDVLQKDLTRTRNQRISINYAVDSLNVHETLQFVRHRLKIAGTEKEIFSPDAILRVYEFSAGIPRRINIICDHAMLSGFAQGKKTITGDMVKECAKNLCPPYFSKEPISAQLKALDSSDSGKKTETTPECLQEIDATLSRKTVFTVFLIAIAILTITYSQYPKECRNIFYRLKNDGILAFSFLQGTITTDLNNFSEPDIDPTSPHKLAPVTVMQISNEASLYLPVAKGLITKNEGSSSMVPENDNTDIQLEVETVSIRTDDIANLAPIEKNSVVKVNSSKIQLIVSTPPDQQDIIIEDSTRKVPVSSEIALIPKAETKPNLEESKNIEKIVLLEDALLSPDVPVAETERTDTMDSSYTIVSADKKRGVLDAINKITDLKVSSDFKEYMTQKPRTDLQDQSIEPAEPSSAKDVLNEDPEYMDPGAVIDWVLKKRSQ